MNASNGLIENIWLGTTGCEGCPSLELCKRFKIDLTNKWYIKKTEKVQEN